MVSSEEAALIFRKWEEEYVPLLFRGYSSLYMQSILCGLESANDGVIRLRMQGLGYIDIRLSQFTFEYFDPAAQRTAPDEEESQNPMDSLTTGAGIVATTPAGDSFILLEILFTE